MNPCPGKKQPMAWLALDALDDRQAQTLREHLAGCPGCRRYFEEISKVTDTLSASGTSAIEPSPRFHQQVMAKLRSTKQDSVWQIVLAQFRVLLNWRVALPVCAMVAAVIILSASQRQHQDVLPNARNAAPATLSPEINVALPPTFANYTMVANQSADQLDDLLVRQGIQDLSSPAAHPPIYSVSYLDRHMF
jgi:anti-sigma factor RsiW